MDVLRLAALERFCHRWTITSVDSFPLIQSDNPFIPRTRMWYSVLPIKVFPFASHIPFRCGAYRSRNNIDQAVRRVG